MISIIITTYRETKTLEQTLRVILAEKLPQEKEILVIAPDDETKNLIQNKFSNQVKFIQDEGEGKPTALNLAFKHAQGEILILTDGDVIIKPESLAKLVWAFENPKVGAVCGQPISISPRNTMLGFWSHFLTHSADWLRDKRTNARKYIDCSGYLYAIRTGIVNELPKNALSDDIFISTQIYNAGYRTEYEPTAQVEVKYPTNFKDWILQKRRSASGHAQVFENFEIQSEMRNFWQEAWQGAKLFFSYPKSLKEFLWLKMLFLTRLYLWLLIFIDKKILRKKYGAGWKRVESSK